MKRFALTLLLLVACGGESFDAPYVGAHRPDNLRRLGPVHGNDCTFYSVFGSVRDISVQTAVEHALEGVQADGIVDFEARTTGGWERCIEVRGTAVQFAR